MKFTVNRTEILNALQICSKGINPNVVIPILENFLFDITSDKIAISGSNKEVYICKTINCKSDASAKLAMPQAVLEQIKLLPEQPLTFEVKDFNVSIKSSTGIYKLTAENGEDFPGIKNDCKSELTLWSSQLQNALFKTAFCVVANSVPTPFDGLSLSIKPNEAIFTAFGNNTLSTKTIAYKGENEAELLLTKRLIDILQSTELGESVIVKYDKSAIDFIIDDTLFIRGVLLDMQFPDFKANVVLDQDKSLIINADILRRGCEVTRVMANKHSFLIGLFLSEKSLTIKASDKNFGRDAKETVSGDYKGEDFVIGVNGNFLITALSKLKGDVYLYFSEKSKPIIIREVDGNESHNNLMIVMPIDIDF